MFQNVVVVDAVAVVVVVVVVDAVVATIAQKKILFLGLCKVTLIR